MSNYGTEAMDRFFEGEGDGYHDTEVVRGHVIKEATKAFLIRDYATQSAIWLPKSQLCGTRIELGSHPDSGHEVEFIVTYVPSWLYKQKG